MFSSLLFSLGILLVMNCESHARAQGPTLIQRANGYTSYGHPQILPIPIPIPYPGNSNDLVVIIGLSSS